MRDYRIRLPIVVWKKIQLSFIVNVIVWPSDTTIDNFFVITHRDLTRRTQSLTTTLWETQFSYRHTYHTCTTALIHFIHHEENTSSTSFFTHQKRTFNTCIHAFNNPLLLYCGHEHELLTKKKKISVNNGARSLVELRQ